MNPTTISSTTVSPMPIHLPTAHLLLPGATAIRMPQSGA